MTGLYVASNPTALTAQYGLSRTMGELGTVLTRLSTGLRINSGKDDPAGLIASELLKSQMTGTTAAIKNTQRANSLIATADSSMSQIGNLLNDIKGLVVEAANTGAMSAEQIAANQLQVNASVESIDRIARTTSYSGKKILDGSLDFRTTGADGGNISNLKVNSANFGTQNAIGVNVNVQQAASNATLIYKGTGVDQKTTLDITGAVGTKSLTFGAGTSNAEIANAINGAADSTGVAAYVEGAAQRGNVILSSAGANNDIVITAGKIGLQEGNWTFRITEAVDKDHRDARIVSDPTNSQAGVIEIAVERGSEANYKDFAGLFDITVQSGDTGLTTSVSITRGAANKVIYHETATSGSATTNGKTLTINQSGGGTINSDYNGWTVVVDNAKTGASGNFVVDQNSKTLYVNEGATAAIIGSGLDDALSRSTPSGAAAVTGTAIVGTGIDFTASGTAAGLQNGDRFTFAGGGDAGEVEITYKEGARADDILKMLNNTANVKASLAAGVDGSTLIPALPTGVTYATGTTAASKYTSAATAQEVIDLINGQLGDKFNAAALKGDTGNGKVSFMDGAADYGSINLDNALRFTGMDNGPLVRMTNLGSNGLPVANQQLSVSVIHPNESDIKAGIHTPILEIKLATDAAGNSITTAKDIADLFDKLTPEKTLGVSAEVLYPPGVDPNGRIFGVDACGNDFELETCPPEYGLGIVQPTNTPGVCGPNQGDLALLGNNQTIEADYAIAKVGTATAVTAIASAAGTLGGTATLTFASGAGSAFNGMKFGFTTDEKKEGFDEATGTLITFLKSDITDNAGIIASVNDAIRSNWESIREYTNNNSLEYDKTKHSVTAAAGGASGAFNDATAYAALPGGDGLTTISASDFIGTQVGTRGYSTEDGVMNITALQKGTQMAGVKIHLITDATMADYATSGKAVNVQMVTAEDGSQELIIRANTTTIDAADVKEFVDILNANDTFNDYFKATGNYGATPAEAVGDLTFNIDVTKPQGETIGGYRVNSPEAVGTSNGISMVGQADSNERLVLQATDAGSENFVNVYVAQGSFTTYDPYDSRTSYTNGSDMIATINGNAASSRGNTISIDTSDLAVELTVANQAGWTGFSIDGGGALFQLGPDVVSAQQMRVGLSSMLATKLGGASGTLFQLKNGGDADLTKSDSSRKLADKIVNEAISSVSNTRGRLGAIQKASLEPNLKYLQDSLVSLTEANQMITEADFAEESSNLTRLQLLMQAGSQALALAGSLPQYAAQLVR